MKRLFIVSLSMLGFVLLTAPTAVEFHPAFLGSKPFGTIAIIDGKYYFPLSDFTKLGGGTVTLEQVGLTLTGNTLKVSSAAYDAFHKRNQQVTPVVVKGYDPSNPKDIVGAAWKSQHDGVITSNAIRFGGGVYIPLADLARAFGGTFTGPANIQPGEAVRLNFTRSPNAILIGL